MESRTTLLLFLCACLCGLPAATAVLAGNADEPPPRFTPPLSFDSELIKLTIEADSLRVDGLYYMSCRGEGERVTVLTYPYPQDDRLGGSRTVSFEHRIGQGSWQDGQWQELDDQRGALWKVPVVPDSTVTIRTTYRQALCEDYARYIVTSTAAWGRPLQRAAFEIRLPADAEPVSFSFPFRLDADGVWRYEAVDFLPDRDIMVEWK